MGHFVFREMNLFKRVNWGMFGLGFGPGQPADDQNKENEPPPLQTPPWVKKQKVIESDRVHHPGPSVSLCPPVILTGGTLQDNSHTNLVQKIRFVSINS